MGLREELVKRIDRKQQEIKELELKVREAYAYIQGLQDTLKLLPKDAGNGQAVALRSGSDMAKAREAIRQTGTPLHVNDILKAIGKPQDKNSRLALAGSLARYARNGQVFVKTGPNIFGLLELGAKPSPVAESVEPPDDFGEPEASTDE